MFSTYYSSMCVVIICIIHSDQKSQIVPANYLSILYLVALRRRVSMRVPPDQYVGKRSETM